MLLDSRYSNRTANELVNIADNEDNQLAVVLAYKLEEEIAEIKEDLEAAQKEVRMSEMLNSDNSGNAELVAHLLTDAVWVKNSKPNNWTVESFVESYHPDNQDITLRKRYSDSYELVVCHSDGAEKICFHSPSSTSAKKHALIVVVQLLLKGKISLTNYNGVEFPKYDI